ncbi:hypothetical protein J19TS2_21000 [Cohnella xylanilytica]|uniref:Two pore domain potassium channel family protein n=1 Tax=Cohnella xylanilytica TaxID=557555 RepID=A0A841TZ76_9BACL|nr:two pore domain potassium channel family protein [Cohnella xylanilytica]GIO12545.1 hypothetical protein J19TS2_21000 [Cohnella xylanilytica]
MISFVLTLKRMISGLLHAFREKSFRTLFALTLIILLSGTMFYHEAERFSYIDALFFSVMTLTTVGSAELAPHTVFGKIFTILYAFAGIGIIFGVIYYVGKGIHFSSSKPKMRSAGPDGEDSAEEEGSKGRRKDS